MLTKQFALSVLITLFIFSGVSQHATAQDTIRKTTVKPKAVVKPGAVRAVMTYPAKTATAAQKPVTPITTTVKTPAPTVVAVQPAPTDRSINGQYQYLLTKLYGYQRPMASAFYKSVTDSLRNVQKKIKPLETTVVTLQDTVKDLHKQLAGQQTEINESSAKVDSISLLGIKMTKSSYNMLMWGLVIVFGVIAIVVITRSGAYAREAKHRIQLYDELDEQHKLYKAKAGEKEKKLARELQTARNKLEELTGKADY